MIKLKITAALILFGLLVVLIANSTLKTISAQQSTLSTFFSPNNVSLKTNDEKIIKLTLSSPQKISGFDLKFQTAGSLIVTDFRDVLETGNKLSPFDYKQLKEVIGASPEIAYIFPIPEANLPTDVTIYIKIKGTVDGNSSLTIDYNNSQTLDANGNLLQITPNQSATYILNPNNSDLSFIDPSLIPAVNYPSTAAVVNLKLNLPQTQTPGTKLKATAVAVGRNGDAKYETNVQEFDITSIGGQVFTGTVAFPNFKDGTNFSLMIRADKYLLRRICNADAAETKPQAYQCTDPSLTIRQGQNTFDFSKLPLLPGDLGLVDGIINGYDLSLIRNNLNKNTREAVALADLNLDGIVDLKDLELITYVLNNTTGKADQ